MRTIKLVVVSLFFDVLANASIVADDAHFKTLITQASDKRFYKAILYRFAYVTDS